ncbi:MAG: phosphatidylglycerophosphatase A [bacterium]
MREGPGEAPKGADHPAGPPGGLAWCTATLCGVGRFPVAPGTAGSAVGVALYWALSRGGGDLLVLAGLALAAAAGVWAGGVVERARGEKDPSEVVMDEVAGQLLCLLAAPPTWGNLAAGFLLFRAIDIVKPFRRIERLPGGWGIVADDLVAGAIGWVLLAAARGADLL